MNQLNIQSWVKTVSLEKKVEYLERVLKAITYADEITYKIDENPPYLLDRVLFHGAHVDYLHFRGYSEGLDLDWDAEIIEEDVPEEFGGGTTQHARLVGEVWIQPDMWETIQELREQLSEFIEKGEENEKN